MRDAALRSEVRRLRDTGLTYARISARLGVPPTTVHRWATREPVVELQPCPVEQDGDALTRANACYGYLLGQYLGDGHLVTSARVPVLRIYTCTDYPAIVEEVSSAISMLRGREPGTVRPRHSDRVVTLQSFWMHWPCLLPQHGSGRKHERSIQLEAWQQELVDASALYAVGVEWRLNRPDSVSIARRQSVALLETQVGPKR